MLESTKSLTANGNGMLLPAVTQADIISCSLRPAVLLCEARANPEGIREREPRLSWLVEAVDAKKRGMRQSAWQIIVSSTVKQLEQSLGDCWDTGKVPGDALCAEYAGCKIVPTQRVWWKIRVWDGNDIVSEWSPPSKWSLGLQDTWGLSEWSGAWIGYDSSDAMREEGMSDMQRRRARSLELQWMQAEMSATKLRPLPPFDAQVATALPPTDTDMPADRPLSAWFRKTFSLDNAETITSASMWIVPDMICDVWINGHYIKRTARWEIAASIDIKKYLRSGKNTIGLEISQQDGYAPAACGEAEIARSDAEMENVPLGKDWHFSENAAPGWSTPEYDAPGWKPVRTFHRPPWQMWENSTQSYLPAPYMRREFESSGNIRRATLFATALGIYEVEINGRRVGEDYFSPGWTHYPRRVHVQTYDVSDLIARGKNAIGVILGDGWFAGVLGHLGKKNSYGGRPRARLMLVVEYDNGEIVKIASDENWRACFGPIRYADMQQGCGYDARLEMPGWSSPGFDDSTWAPVSLELRPLQDEGVPTTQMILEGSTLDGVRVTGELPARSITEPSKGIWVADFGQNFVGWVRMRVNGRAGQRILFRHAEMLNPNGSIYTSNLRGAAAADEFWLKGVGVETLEPKFTFHGFRYLEIQGLSEAPDAEDFIGVIVHTPMKRTGWFESSDANLNRLYENIIWGQRGNYLEVPTDCPQRDERLGWTGDTQFFARTAAYNYDVRAFLERWLVTLIEDSQAADGTFASVSPIVPMRRGMASTAWGDAAIICSHVLWMQYGGIRHIKRHFGALLRYVEWLRGRAENGIVLVGGYGDWLHKGGTAKTEVIDTAYYAHLCELMAEMARAIGLDDKATELAGLHNEVKAAFARAFMQKDGALLGSSQTGYALAFTMRLVPDELREAAAERFVETLKAFGWHLATGFIGTPRLIPGLFDANCQEAAWRILMQDTYPSWLYQVKLGATTMWERWDGWTPEEGFQAVSMNSFNHYAFGAVGEALYRYVAGIDSIGPGFRNIEIYPRIGGGLTYARVAYDAVTGRIECAWQIEADGSLAVRVVVPVGCRATIRLPKSRTSRISEGGAPLGEAPGLEAIEIQERLLTCTAASGIYNFKISL